MTPNFKLESHLQLLLKKESQVHDFLDFGYIVTTVCKLKLLCTDPQNHQYTSIIGGKKKTGEA